MTSPVEISVVIPCLNEERAIAEVVAWGWEGIEPDRPRRRGDRRRQRLDRPLRRAGAGRRRARRPRAAPRLRQRVPARARRGPRRIRLHGRRRRHLRPARHGAVPRAARLGQRVRARLPFPGPHPRRRDALEAPLDRQPDPDGDPERLLRRQGLGRTLRPPRDPAEHRRPARPARDGHGVRLGDDPQGRQAEDSGRRGADRLLPANRRVEAEHVAGRLAPSALHARPQRDIPLHHPGTRPLFARLYRDAGAGGRADRGLRRALVHPRDDHRQHGDARGRADRPARSFRADLRRALPGRA